MIETITRIQVRRAEIDDLRAHYSKQFPKQSCVFIQRKPEMTNKKNGEYLVYLYDHHITLPNASESHSLVFDTHKKATDFTLNLPDELGYAVCYRRGQQICTNQLKVREYSYD